MILKDVVSTIESLNDELIICVKRPWHADAECVLAQPDESLKVPDDLKCLKKT